MMMQCVVVVGKEYCSEEARELTVRKTSLFFPGDGFEAYDHHTGELVFRVDAYNRPKVPSLAEQELVLMGPDGDPILTLRKKWPSLHQRWEGFLGERVEGQKPVFSVKRSSIFGEGRSVVAVELHDGTCGGSEYRVEGSFAQRCCRVIVACNNSSDEDAADAVGSDRQFHDAGDELRSVGAEIKRKVDPCANVVLGKDVFCLCVKPRFDAALAMGLVLVLDQIAGSDGDRDHAQDHDSSTAAAPSPDQPHSESSK